MELQDLLKQAEEDLEFAERSQRTLTNAIGKMTSKVDDIKQQIAAAEVTYSVGDRFNYMDKEEILLITLWLGPDENRDVVGLVRISNGRTWNAAFDVADVAAITRAEIGDSIGCLVRTWDARKQCKC